MSKSRIKNIGKFESPYQRVLVLFVGIVAVIALILGINFVVRGLGGNEKKLVDAIVTSLKEPRINGDASMATQAQTNTFDAKATFSIDKLSKLAASGEINATFQGEAVKVPVDVYGDLNKSTTYVKASNTKKLAEVIGGSAPTLKADLSSIANKVDGKWLRIQQQENKVNSCTINLFNKIAHDESAGKEIAGIYAGNRFITVESVEEKGQEKQEYTVKYDTKAMTSFLKSLKTKELFTSTKGCDATFDPLGTEAAATQNPTQAAQQAQQPTTTTKITVEKDHVINFVSVASANNQVNTTRVSLNYKSGDALVAPKSDIVDSSTLKSEMASIGRIFQQQQQSAALNQQQQISQ